MESRKRNIIGFSLLAVLWLVVGSWQVHEHMWVRESAETSLRNRSKDIANTLSAFIRGLRFRGAILQERLDPVLVEMIHASTNELVKASELISIVLVNAQNEPVAAAGAPVDLQQREVVQRGERWGRRTLTIINPVDLGAIVSEGSTNPTVVLPAMTNAPGEPGRGFDRDGRRPPDFSRPPEPPSDSPPRRFSPESSEGTNLAQAGSESRRRTDRWPRRPPWLRDLTDEDYQSLMTKRALHGVVLVLSTEALRESIQRDLWMRGFIMLLATLSVAGIGFAWRNFSKTSELQIRLVRASEMNTHLKEMNLAAAGLAHETRNPLNIIRGQAQIISRQTGMSPELQQRAQGILAEVDKVAAQLNEFINYSRPREVRRTPVALESVASEITRALGYDIDEKHVTVKTAMRGLVVEADEQLLRQAMFNLLLNAVQAVGQEGQIEISADRHGAGQAVVEIRDNGPGVPTDKRSEIFKPYFTTQKAGTGLGLAVCQQIVLAHGWEMECLPNQPTGAIFRISHIKAV